MPRWRAARPMLLSDSIRRRPMWCLPVDESMTCNGIAASFRFSARRAARLEYWLAVGPLAGYGYERFPQDAPKQLIDERRRLDALSDLQRYKGCIVMEPGPAVVEERLKLEGSIKRAPPVLNSTRLMRCAQTLGRQLPNVSRTRRHAHWLSCISCRLCDESISPCRHSRMTNGRPSSRCQRNQRLAYETCAIRAPDIRADRSCCHPR